MIRYGCCVGSWEKFHTHVAPQTTDRQTMALAGQHSIVAAYNAILDWAQPMHPGDALILLHDDLQILDPDAEAKFLDAIGDGADLVGVAGGGGRTLTWWDHHPIGHQRTDAVRLDFGARAGDVTLLEGSCLVLSPWLVHTLRFDPRFPGWHGYDEIGRQVVEAGRRVTVVDVDTHHHNPLGFRSDDSAAQYQRAVDTYRVKWG